MTPAARIHVPDGTPWQPALTRCTHLAVGAHQDDLEFWNFHGILACRNQPDRWFGGVVCTDGGGSSRSGSFAAFTDEAMRRVRAEEQETAARLGDYGIIIQLGHPSATVKNPADTTLSHDLQEIFATARPEVVYCHNPADKHDTHVAAFSATLTALRSLPARDRPRQVFGCEAWRDLDWMPDSEKVLLDVSGAEEFARQINGVFASQIAGGKRYDLAVLGRRRANATFFDSHASDAATDVTLAMDLTPLVADPTRDVVDFVCGHIDRFRADVANRLGRHLLR
jgi:LmbE family N-acetylglucosaminyl deacetylase